MRNFGFNRRILGIGWMSSGLLLLFFLTGTQIIANAQSNPDAAPAINAVLSAKQHPLLNRPDFSAHLAALTRLYQLNDNQLLWLGENRAENTINQALSLLANAATDGLVAADYDADTLKRHYQTALALPKDAIHELARFDTTLSIALIRFINDLHHGRIDPGTLDYPAEFGRKPKIDAATLLQQAMSQQTLQQLPDTLAPKIRQYALLKQALTRYRQLPAEENIRPLVFPTALRPGEFHPQLADLRARLIAVDALPHDTPATADNDLYSEALQEGVKTFQRQNGLQADGVIGKDTATRLNQSRAQRIEQIELTLERLRWLPDDLNGPLIIVNIPAFQLWAYDTATSSEALNMKVIVGKALQNQTPVLLEEMKYLEFMPYWNIPSSIMKKEILPILYDNWGYLQNQDIELVQVRESSSEEWDGVFDDIRQGRVRARQRPGKKNPLGKVKFIFPNQDDVYLHDTSTPSLFNRSRRDFSHGCVRVEKAQALAEFVLNRQPDSNWDSSAIQQAMSGSKTRHVTLQNPIPVIFLYATAFADQEGQVRFYPDIYQQDAKLAKALGKTPNAMSTKALTDNPPPG